MGDLNYRINADLRTVLDAVEANDDGAWAKLHEGSATAQLLSTSTRGAFSNLAARLLVQPPLRPRWAKSGGGEARPRRTRGP